MSLFRKVVFGVLVILDSNILCRDFYMQGTQSQMLLQFGKIVVPEIVYDEVLNKHCEKLMECRDNLSKKLEEYNRLLFEPCALDEKSDLETEQKHYEDFLIQLMMENGFYPPEPYPNVPHRDVVNRSLQRKKPFKPDGRVGYRDYLVWRTVLEIVARSVDEVHFISANSTDFADEQDRNKLHSDLLDEMKSLGIDESKLKYWATLKDFIEEVVKPALEQLDEEKNMIEKLTRDHENFMLPVSIYVINTLKGFDVSGYDVIVPGEMPLVEDVDMPDKIMIEGISKIDDSKVLVEVSSYFFSIIESRATKAEVVAMSKVELENSTINALDAKIVEIHTDVSLQADIEVIYDTKNQQICSIEIVDVSDSSYCVYCPYD